MEEWVQATMVLENLHYVKTPSRVGLAEDRGLHEEDPYWHPDHSVLVQQ